MLNDEILNQIFENRQEKIEEKIQQEYHKRIKLITEKESYWQNSMKKLGNN